MTETKRQRITREILRHVDSIMADKELDVTAMSGELQEFLRPLTMRQVKAVVLAAAKTDDQFWDKFGVAMELLLVEGVNIPDAGDKEGLGALVGDALVKARSEIDAKLNRGLRLLRGGARDATPGQGAA